MKLIEIVEGLYMLLWIEFILACGCMVLSWFVPIEDCFYILFTVITAINGIATMNLQNKLKKEEEEQCNTEK